MAGRGWVRASLGALVPAVVLAALGGAALWRYRASGPLPSDRAIVVPAGSTARVSRALAHDGAIEEPRLFVLAALATSRAGPLRAGEFEFPRHASYARVLEVLRKGVPVEHRVTIPEGLTAQEIAALLEKAPALSGPVSIPAEAWVLPNTYDYLYGTKRQAIVQRAHAALEAKLAKLWARRAPDLPVSTPEQALVLASIVTRETALPAERPQVSAVYLNRLKLGMPLDADPTVIYAASGGSGRLPGPITAADLKMPSPYNTYRQAGLPPGPIDAPGIAAITAVLHPATSDDLYFVADGTGGHAFARTLAEQNRNVARWHATLDQQAETGTR
ncbi:MAG: endolytic transglycosylase MltG [Acetobacteraceae bacterium]